MRDTFDLPWFDVGLIELTLEVDRGRVAMQFFQREFETLARSFEDRYPDFDLMRGDGVQCGAKPIIIEPGGIDSEQIVYPVLCCPFAHPVKRLRVEGQPVQDHCLEQMPISSFNLGCDAIDRSIALATPSSLTRARANSAAPICTVSYSVAVFGLVITSKFNLARWHG